MDVEADADLVIVPDVAHRVEPSDDARFCIAFHRLEGEERPGAASGARD